MLYPIVSAFFMRDFGWNWKVRIGETANGNGNRFRLTLWLPKDSRAASHAKVKCHLEPRLGLPSECVDLANYRDSGSMEEGGYAKGATGPLLAL